MPEAADPIAGKVELGTAPPETTLAPLSPSARKIEFGPVGGFLERAGAAIPPTTEGKVKFLERLYGVGNVKTTADGTILIPTPDGEALQPFDEDAFTLRDVTSDLAGVGVEVAPTLAAGNNPYTVAAAGVAGAATREVAAELLSGGTGEPLGSRALRIATTGAIAGGSAAIFNIGARAFDTIFRPGNWAARHMQKVGRRRFAKRGQRLSERTGIALTPGEETGARSVLMAGEGSAPHAGQHPRQLRQVKRWQPSEDNAGHSTACCERRPQGQEGDKLHDPSDGRGSRSGLGLLRQPVGESVRPYWTFIGRARRDFR